MPTHTPISPAILYFGTPVVLITTLSPENHPNIGPMSSAWWIGHNCMLGLDPTSCTTHNILRTGECVLNLPSDGMAARVNAIAKTTGSEVVPESKRKRGYVHCKDKFRVAGLTEMRSQLVQAPGIEECPVVMEARLVGVHEMFGDKAYKRAAVAIEVEIVRVSVHEELRLMGHENRIDVDKWQPMIMMFSELFGLRSGRLVDSRLAEIEEESYRLPRQEKKVNGEEPMKWESRAIG